MPSPTLLVALAPLVLGISKAVSADSLNGSDDFSANVTMYRRDLLSNLSSPALTEVFEYPCDKYPDPKPCYKKYYETRHSCHPFDQACYKDCHSWDDYKRRCQKREDKCYDKCYYENKDCHKYENCRKGGRGGEGGRGDRDNGDCYKKHKDYYDHQDHCKPECRPEDKDCYKCRKECPPWDQNCQHDYRPPRYCKPDCRPDDHSCYKCRVPDNHGHRDRECSPWRDRDCFPGYPPYSHYPPPWEGDDDDDDDDYHPHHPKSYITVNYFGPEGTYQEKVWPDGDEHWNDEHYKHFKIDHIKYYAEQEDSDIRCLPMKSWFPWTPLPIERYVERTEEYGLVVRVLQLKKPMPIEVIRCDVP